MKIYELVFNIELEIKIVIEIRKLFKDSLPTEDQNKTLGSGFTLIFGKGETICRIREDLLHPLQDFLGKKFPDLYYIVCGYWEFHPLQED